MTNIGFDKPVYILHSDHRGSFQTQMFGWKGALSLEQSAQIASTKQVIYDGFKTAVMLGVPKDKAGILQNVGRNASMCLSNSRVLEIELRSDHSSQRGRR